MEHHCCSHEDKKKPWYRDLFFWSALISGLLIILSFWITSLASFRHAFFLYIQMMTIPVTIGFLLGGVIDYYIPSEYIGKYLTKSQKRTIFYATGLGFLMSSCNHGILALSMELHKKGASGPAVVSFLLASPWANLPITLLLFGFFGWRGLLVVLTAFLIAIVTGLIFQALDDRGWIEKNRHAVEIDPEFSIRRDLVKRWKNYVFSWKRFLGDAKGIAKGIWNLIDMTFSWILIGAVLASLSAAYVPHHLFQHYFGPTLFGLAVTLVASAILEVCSEGTSPIAFEIYRQTKAFGNSFAFLMGGVSTDYTEIGLLWKNLGPRTALWMLGITLPQVIVIGWIYNQLF